MDNQMLGIAIVFGFVAIVTVASMCVLGVVALIAKVVLKMRIAQSQDSIVSELDVAAPEKDAGATSVRVS